MSGKLTCFLLAGMALLLAACAPAPVPAPGLTPQVLQVEISTSLRDLSPALSDCARQMGLGLSISELPTPSLDESSAGMRLRWGAPADVPGYAAVLGEDSLAVVVHPSNPLTRLTRAQLRAIYTGSARFWSDLPDCPACADLKGKEIHAWAYAAGEDIQQIFENGLGQRVQPAAAGTAPHPEAARQAVAEDPLAIGFLPARLVDGSVRTVDIDNLAEGGFTRPVLALSPAEPQGLPRQWLACLQEKLKP